MSAFDMLESYNRSLSNDEQEQIALLLARIREDMLSARSEEARVRLVDAYIVEAREWLSNQQKSR
jgi:hypothetical protein